MKRAALACLLVLAACGGTSPSGAPLSTPGVATTGIGPIDLAPGDEKTVCIYKRLDNAEPLSATKITAELAPGSHHLIVYRATATEEDLEPKSCQPFGGITDGRELPVAIIGTAQYEFEFPANVGLSLEPHQMLKIEAHYINATPNALQGSAKVTFQGDPSAASTLIPADIGFWGTTKIDIAPNASLDTGVKFQPGIEGTTAFAVTTHQHRLGKRFRIWESSDATTAQSSTPLVDENDWREPRLKKIAPGMAFDGKSGLSYECEWQNTTDQEVIFGESALNEMCFMFVYYYPSRGFDLCLDGACINRH